LKTKGVIPPYNANLAKLGKIANPQVSALGAF
jgi:hypothetical protein